MSVSFTGIKDCKIYKKEYTKEGIYKDEDGDYRRGDKNCREIMMTARLTDDKDGDHLTQYLMSMPVGFENTKGHDLVNIHLIKSIPQRNEDDVYLPNVVSSDEANNTSELRLNGRKFNIDRDSKLRMAEFLAHTTKRDLNITDMSDKQKKYAGVINREIQRQACDYLDV